MNVLIVDDDPMVMESCRRIIAETEFTPVCASSVDAALELMEKKPFHLIIADIKMPEKDGLYLISICKKRYPHIPILVISGYSTEETIRHSLATGAEKYIPKPFTPEELTGAIREVINKQTEKPNGGINE